MKSLWLFAALQVGDMASTLAIIHYGGGESNPALLFMFAHFGVFFSLLLVKVFLVGVAVYVRNLRWLANIYYLCVVLYNLALVFILIHGRF